MNRLPSRFTIRLKAVGGRSVLLGVLVASKAARTVPQQHPKLVRALNDVADSAGESDVIVEFHDDTNSASRIRANGGEPGRKLSILKARAGRMPNALIKRLANDPKVKRVHLDREAAGQIARTAATVGAKNVHAQYGYSGAGIGVAVVDSGITAWHDGPTVANRLGQRVSAFVDFVNRQTAKYDDRATAHTWPASSPATTWGDSAGDGDNFGDDTAEYESFDPTVWEDLFEVPLFTAPTTTTTTISLTGGLQ